MYLNSSTGGMSKVSLPQLVLTGSSLTQSTLTYGKLRLYAFNCEESIFQLEFYTRAANSKQAWKLKYF
jgi:hypothetical protein